MAKKVFLFLALGGILFAPFLASAAVSVTATPAILNFGETATQLTFTLKNTGDTTLLWEIPSNPSSLISSIIPRNGTLPSNETATVVVTVTRAFMVAGETKTDFISIAKQGETPTLAIVEVRVSKAGAASAPCAAAVNLCQGEAVIGCDCGTAKVTAEKRFCRVDSNQVFITQIACQTALSCPATANTCQAALSAPCLCGTTAAIAGQFCWSVGNQIFAAKAACQTAMAAIDPIIQVTPTNLGFGESETIKTIKIKNIGGGSLIFAIIKPMSMTWLTIAPAPLSGTLTTGAENIFTFTVSRASLTPGSYSGIVAINSINLTVTMSVPTTETPANNEPMIPSGLAKCEMAHNIRGCASQMQDPENALPCASNPTACTNCNRKAGTDSCKVEACCILDRVFTVADWIFVILIVVSALFIIWGAFSFVLSGGDTEKVTSAKNKIIWALVGIVVAFLSQGIVRLIVQIIAK